MHSSTGTSMWASGMHTFPPVPYQEGNAKSTSPVTMRQTRTPGLSWEGTDAARVHINSAYLALPAQPAWGSKAQVATEGEKQEREKGTRQLPGEDTVASGLGAAGQGSPHTGEQNGGETGGGPVTSGTANGTAWRGLCGERRVTGRAENGGQQAVRPFGASWVLGCD